MKLLRFKEFEDFCKIISVGDILIDDVPRKNEKFIITNIDIISLNEIKIYLFCFSSDLDNIYLNNFYKYYFSKRTWNYFHKKIIILR